jgi:cytochrome P450
LWTADPKAISHILKYSDTLYRKPNGMRELIALITDRGLIWADGNTFTYLVPLQILTWAGDAHKRQRRAMSPAFGLVEAKGLLPYFTQSATKVGSYLMSAQRCDR